MPDVAKCLRCGHALEPVARVYESNLEWWRSQKTWSAYHERPIFFTKSLKQVKKRLESVTAETKKEQQKKRKEYERELESLPLHIRLLGCRNCGYIEWRMVSTKR